MGFCSHARRETFAVPPCTCGLRALALCLQYPRQSSCPLLSQKRGRLLDANSPRRNVERTRYGTGRRHGQKGGRISRRKNSTATSPADGAASRGGRWRTASRLGDPREKGWRNRVGRTKHSSLTYVAGERRNLLASMVWRGTRRQDGLPGSSPALDSRHRSMNQTRAILGSKTPSGPMRHRLARSPFRGREWHAATASSCRPFPQNLQQDFRA